LKTQEFRKVIDGEHAASQEAHPPQCQSRGINHARISRIRSFVKQVESALAAGKKDEAAEA
jgi:ribosomal protein S20